MDFFFGLKLIARCTVTIDRMFLSNNSFPAAASSGRKIKLMADSKSVSSKYDVTATHVDLLPLKR
jgi:hypothetical protein